MIVNDAGYGGVTQVHELWLGTNKNQAMVVLERSTKIFYIRCSLLVHVQNGLPTQNHVQYHSSPYIASMGSQGFVQPNISWEAYTI